MAMNNNVVPRWLLTQRGGAMLMEDWKLYTMNTVKRFANGLGYRQYWKWFLYVWFLKQTDTICLVSDTIC
jgi:hypothetical protein